MKRVVKKGFRQPTVLTSKSDIQGEVANRQTITLKKKEMDSVKKKKKVPASALCFSEPAEISLSKPNDDGKQFFSMSAYSGKVIKNHSWFGDLAIDVSGIQFRQKRIPILEEHYLSKKLGISTSKPSLEGNKVFFEKIKLLNNEIAQEFKQNLDDEFPYQASISIRPTLVEHLEEGAKAEVNGYTMKGPGRILRQSIFREASACVFGADHRTSVQSLSDDEEFEYEEIQLSADGKQKTQTPKKKNNVKGENRMDFTDVKKNDPDLYLRITEALSEKDTEIKSLKDSLETEQGKVTDLEGKNKELKEANSSLERAQILQKEKDLKDQAQGIVVKSLSESKLPARIQKRVQASISHEEFVDDDSNLKVENFTEHVEKEIGSWEEDFKDKETSTSILGLSAGGGEGGKEDDSEDLSDTMVSFATKEKKKED